MKWAISLLPLDGFNSAVPSFQLHSVSHTVSKRVPPSNAMSRFIGFGDKSRDSFKNSFQTQGIEFSSQGAQRGVFWSSITLKTLVSKLIRPFARKPPVAIVSESTRMTCERLAKPQVAGLRHQRAK